jgi:small subunit ribosomal protein S1
MTEEKKETGTPNPSQEQPKEEMATTTNEQPTPEPQVQEEEFKEEVVKLEDLEEETEYSPQEMETLKNLYDQTLEELKEGEVVTGRILSITDSDVIVDIGFKSEGIVPKEEFDNIEDLKPGDEVEVYVDELDNGEGQVVLSRRRADFIKNWERVIEKYENDEVIPGTITRRIKGGMVVNILGVDAFLPGSQIDVKPIRDFDALIGKQMNFKIVKVNRARKNIVVSSRALIEKELEGKRKEILETLEKGQVRKGIVKNITDFGVFIDLGGVDGLLHITDLSWGRVNHPSELVKLDQELEVMVLDFNENKDRISLGLKQLQPHPWDNVEEKYPVNSVVKGRVVSITDYGAFVELEKGIEGLIHISEMSWSQHIKHPSQILTVGQEVEAMVLNVEPEQKKISLGLKQLEPDPWENIEERYPVGSIHKGIVRNITQFGVFVELEEGIDGLVHISDLSWTRKIQHPSEIVKKNDEIEVMVLGINREERRIALGHKQIEPNPWDTFEEVYKVGAETTGKIARFVDKGVIVTLPHGVDAFIPNQHIPTPKGKKPSEIYEIGAEVHAKVLEFDKENKKIVLSVNNYFRDKERKDYEEYLEKQGIAKNTIEDMIKHRPLGKVKKEEAKAAKEEKKEEPKEAKAEEKQPEAKETKSEAEVKEEPKEEAKAEETEKAEAKEEAAEAPAEEAKAETEEKAEPKEEKKDEEKASE